MALASAISMLSPSAIASGDKNVVRDLWNLLSPLPGGRFVFSRAVGMAAPYTNTIGATVEDLRAGHAEVTMPDRHAVRNHLSSVHAVALVNLAELTGNVALAYSLPDDARFIVAGLAIEYLKKSRGTIRGICDCEVPATSERREYQVVVSMRDPSGDEVAKCTLRSLVGPKRASRGAS